MIFGVFSGAIWFSFFLSSHLAIFLIWPIRSRARIYLGCYGLAILGHLVSSVLVNREIAPEPIAWGLLILLGLFILYTPFYYSISTSLSIQSMILILRSPRQSLPVSVLRENFASRALVQGRLETMVTNGYLKLDGNRYRLTTKGRFMSAVFRHL